MNDDWLETSDENINVKEIMRQIRERVASRSGTTPPVEENPEAAAEALWKEMIGNGEGGLALGQHVSIRQHDCDIVPRYYVIDWRIPILGPIHAVVRRIINAEIRRYLFPSLEKQSRFNRQALRALESLSQENVRLRQEIQELERASKGQP
jgi:hypothetical protein